MTEAAPQAPPGRKILVAEHGPIAPDLLKLFLSQRGHEVDTVINGREALEALRNKQYDVALLDFHMPGIDGAEVAVAIKREGLGRRPLRLVAITADMEGLLASSMAENFDSIIAKPLNIFEVGKLVEEQAEIGDRARQTETAAPRRRVHELDAEPVPGKPSSFEVGKSSGKQAGIGGRALQAARAVPAPGELSFFEERGYQVLSWPRDVGTARLSARATRATLGDPGFDALLIEEPVSRAELATLWRCKALFALPVIDLTGTLGGIADLDGSKLSARDTGELDRVIRAFRDQRARLHRDLLLTDDPAEQLLGRVFVSNRPLMPAYDAGSQSLVLYNTILGGGAVARQAEALCEQGLLKREFFDRLNVCPRCNSARLHVREECAKCRSANLADEPYLHHFACAFQGPKSQFRRGSDLICPKCEREVTHFGFDYDKPGTMIVCKACGHAASEPVVGFVCLDCGAHANSEACPTRDIYSYQITSQGTGFAEYGQSFLGQARHALRFTELPIELVVALNAAAKKFTDEKTPFTLVNIFYQNEREITAAHGAREFAQARDLFIENLRNSLGESGMAVKGQSYDFMLLRDREPDLVREEFDTLKQTGERASRLDLGVKFQAFGPEDFS